MTTVYLRCGRLLAVCVEMNVAFGLRPLFQLRRFEGEFIIDVPYMQVILTPFRRMNDARDCTTDENYSEDTDCAGGVVGFTTISEP